MKALPWIIIILLIGLGAYWVMNKEAPVITPTTNNTTINSTQSTTTVTINATTTGAATSATVVVTYTNSGFTPKTITINKGDTVKFVNQSSGGMWVGSASHPSHTVYDGTTLQEHCADGAAPSFDSCKSLPNGSSYSFTFDKAGTWGYHNHSASSFFGSVVVK